MNLSSLAGIQYMGKAGITDSCLKAIARLVHFGDEITDTKLLTCDNKHCFLFLVNEAELVAIKSGFSSGYIGEGPRGLSFALELLYSLSKSVREYAIDKKMIDRIDASCLMQSDLEELSSRTDISPLGGYEYILRADSGKTWLESRELKYIFPEEIPLGIIDSRIVDLAINFRQNPDSAIMNGYKRLEEIVRKRTGLLHEYGEKLFSKTFMRDDSLLYWKNLHPAEVKGRASLFSATFMGYRNYRAHKEVNGTMGEEIREFLLLNQLYCMEAKAIERTS
jgi:hypothetical protein